MADDKGELIHAYELDTYYGGKGIYTVEIVGTKLTVYERPRFVVCNKCGMKKTMGTLGALESFREICVRDIDGDEKRPIYHKANYCIDCIKEADPKLILRNKTVGDSHV